MKQCDAIIVTKSIIQNKASTFMMLIYFTGQVKIYKAKTIGNTTRNKKTILQGDAVTILHTK